jgi:methionyl aminopeptidase
MSQNSLARETDGAIVNHDLDCYLQVGRWASQALDYARAAVLTCRNPVELADGVKSYLVQVTPEMPRWQSVGIGVNDRYINNLWYSPDPFQAGDLVTVEIGLDVQGYYVEAAECLAYLQAGEADMRLIEVADRALDAAIGAAVVGNRVRDISRAIQEYIEGQGFHVSLFGAGHAVKVDATALDNRVFPWIPNRLDSRVAVKTPGGGTVASEVTSSLDTRLAAGMCLSLEPIVNAGSPGAELDYYWISVPGVDRQVRLPFWRTASGDRTAKFVATVLLTDRGAVVLAGPRLATAARPPVSAG